MGERHRKASSLYSVGCAQTICTHFQMVTDFCLRVFDALFIYLHIFVLCYHIYSTLLQLVSPSTFNTLSTQPRTTTTTTRRVQEGSDEQGEGSRHVSSPQVCYFPLLFLCTPATTPTLAPYDDNDRRPSSTTHGNPNDESSMMTTQQNSHHDVNAGTIPLHHSTTPLNDNGHVKAQDEQREGRVRPNTCRTTCLGL